MARPNPHHYQLSGLIGGSQKGLGDCCLNSEPAARIVIMSRFTVPFPVPRHMPAFDQIINSLPQIVVLDHSAPRRKSPAEALPDRQFATTTNQVLRVGYYPNIARRRGLQTGYYVEEFHAVIRRHAFRSRPLYNLTVESQAVCPPSNTRVRQRRPTVNRKCDLLISSKSIDIQDRKSVV